MKMYCKKSDTFFYFTKKLQKTFYYTKTIQKICEYFTFSFYNEIRIMKLENERRKYMKLRKWLVAGVAALGISVLLAGCGSGESQNKGSTVTGSGSSALLPLAKKAASAFKEKNPDVSIILNAGGSGVGLKQVSEGSVDIGNSDVDASMKLPSEKAKELQDHKVCIVTVAAVVNKDIYQDVKNITKEQLRDIFTSKIKNWKEVGGPDEEIVLITRPKTSGTRMLFTKYALDGMDETANATLETDDNGTLIENVSQTKGAIGYVALPYVRNSKFVNVLAIDGVEPTVENTYNGKYPVWGYEHMYTKGEAKGAVKNYIDFFTSEEFGKIIEELGYGITSKMQVSR